LTDAIASLMKVETVEAFHMTGKSHDCGSKLGYMNSFVRDPNLGEDFIESVAKLLKQYQQ